MISKTGFLVLIFLSGQVIGQSDDECFLSGECVSSTHIGGEVVANRDDCRVLCKTTAECAWFTYYPGGKFCQLFKNCEVLNVETCDDCLSGQPECETTKPICFVKGECDGQVLQTSQAVASRSDCLRSCQQTKNCTWFTYLPSAFVCIMYETCPVFDESCGDTNGCVSGESRCEVEYTPESPWHLLIGGKTGAVYTNTAELYNWQTGKQCFIEPLPEGFGLHSGTLINGDPFVCGGANPALRAQCYQYEREKKHWIKRVDLLVATSQAANVYRQDQGWFLFGGNDIGTTQKLVSVESKWEYGPKVQAASIKGQCAVQISENVTAFIGGSINPTSIFTYDWSSPTPTFDKQGQSLLKSRVGSTCGLMLGSDGLPVVAIIGGQEKGMEVWNPRSLTIENLWNEIPAEEGAATGLSFGGMIPVKDGSEFMYYGGYKGSHHKGLWKYVVAQNSWTRVGSTLVARGEHVTLPVSGIECPP